MLNNALDHFLAQIQRHLGDRLRTDDDALIQVASDESGLPPGKPAAVVFPKNASEVQLIAKTAFENSIAIVPRGAGTGKAGACIPINGEVVVDLSRMNHVLQVRPDDLIAVVEPGVINRQLDQTAAEVHMMYPPDPASRDACTIGGNISTNAGGPHAVKYGVTQRYVWGLEVVLANGDVLRMGRQSLKGVVGFDLTSLFVGSEGLLGIITEATMHIIGRPASVETAWLCFPNVRTTSAAAEKIFAAGIVPCTFELLDEVAIDVIRGKTTVPLPRSGGACLLAEVDGPENIAYQELLRLCEIAGEAGATDSALATSEGDRENMRQARRLVSPRLKERYPYKLSDDIAVPRGKIPFFLERVAEVVAPYPFRLGAYGHLGDGNVHINLLCKTPEEQAQAQTLRRRLFSMAIELGGTMSGEHGVGLAKRDELPLEQSNRLIQLQRDLKKVFDPSSILNPNKVFPKP